MLRWNGTLSAREGSALRSDYRHMLVVRRTARGGRDSIDHAPGGHDDLANAVAGVSADYAKGNFDLDLYTRMDWVVGPDFASAAADTAGAAGQQDRVHSVDLCRPFSVSGALGPASPWRSPYWK